MSNRFLPVVFLGGAILTIGSCQAVRPTSINQCVAGENCIVEGRIIASKKKGRIEDRATCIAVALPPSDTGNWDGQHVRASGLVYRKPDLPGLWFTYTIRDREFDAEACYDDLAMYVEQIEIVNSGGHARQP